MNKKNIEWIIKIFTGILIMISYGISTYKKSAVIFLSTTFFLLIVVIIVLWNNFNKEKNAKEVSKRKTKKLENKIKILQNNICPNCKKVYSHNIDETISFDENMRDCFSVVDELSDKEGIVYQLNWYIFIDFSLHLEDRDNESYLIDLVNGSIYLPLDDKWEKIIDGELSYRIFCSKRRISHLGRTILI